MADWYTVKVLTTRYEWRVKTPTTQVQVQQMIHAANNEKNTLLNRKIDTGMYDNDVMLTVGDDEIIVYFELEKEKI